MRFDMLGAETGSICEISTETYLYISKYDYNGILVIKPLLLQGGAVRAS